MTVTRETITCRKCRAAGIHNFVRRIEYLEGGSADSIICLICGDRLASKPVISSARMSDKERLPEICAVPGCGRTIQESRANAGATLCSRCEHHGKNLDLSRPPRKDAGTTKATLPCAVADCDGKIAKNNRSGLCQRHRVQLEQFNRYSGKHRGLGLPPIIRTPTGYITRAAYLAAQPQEVTHVETISELPRLAPPAPPAPAVRHQARRIPQLRRDDHQGVNELARLLATLGLYPDAATIASWTPAERREVEEFVASLDTDQTVPMPDVLCPIYDAAYIKRSA